jgi:branched-chain amino acid transport system permease protein
MDRTPPIALSARRSLVAPLAGLAGLVFVFVLPQWLDSFLISMAILIVFWSYLGAAWNILGGYAGQFSFGHAAFFGIGAYSSTWLLLNLQVNPWIGILVGGLLAMAFGLGIGFVSWHSGLKGPYFALATFAFAEMLRLIATNLPLVNRSLGLQIPLIGGNSWLAFQFEQDKRPYYYIALGMLLLALVITFALSRSKAGYYLQAIREDEDAAAALGVPVIRYKLLAMAISAFLTALGGTFYAQYLFFIDPGLVFGAAVSVEILLRPLIGGVATVAGPLVGGLLLTPLSELTRSLTRETPDFLPFLAPLQGRAGVDVMIYGALLVLVVLYLPDGLLGWMRERWRQLQRLLRR